MIGNDRTVRPATECCDWSRSDDQTNHCALSSDGKSEMSDKIRDSFRESTVQVDDALEFQKESRNVVSTEMGFNPGDEIEKSKSVTHSLDALQPLQENLFLGLEM